MLNGSFTPTQHSSSNAPRSTPANFEDSASSACPQFVCVSSALRRLLLQVEITAPRLHLATLEGESGTGKHLLAQNIHRQSELAAQPFRRRDAREWLANESDSAALSGTLYLDRVDLLASAGQGLLLNLIKMLQSEAPQPPRFLLLVSAHATLRQLAGQGIFLPDLAFRLTGVRFSIPPLREHREDIAPIAQAHIDRICRRYQQPTAVLAQGTLPRLLQHGWPGNVRELASVLESAILDSTTGILRPGDLALHIPISPTSPISRDGTAAPPASPNPSSLLTELPDDLTLDAAIRRHIQLVLELHRGNKLRAARQLGISRSTLYRLLSGASIAPVAGLNS
jgi:two-component system response regulator AtoC